MNPRCCHSAYPGSGQGSRYSRWACSVVSAAKGPLVVTVPSVKLSWTSDKNKRLTQFSNVRHALLWQFSFPRHCLNHLFSYLCGMHEMIICFSSTVLPNPSVPWSRTISPPLLISFSTLAVAHRSCPLVITCWAAQSWVYGTNLLIISWIMLTKNTDLPGRVWMKWHSKFYFFT